MDGSSGMASAASRDSVLTLRRVERQQWLVERLHAAGERVTIGRLARDLGVSERTVARDLERLRHSGVPIAVAQGRGGGASLGGGARTTTVELDVAEVAALVASLAALGPTASASSASAMHKLTRALRPGP